MTPEVTHVEMTPTAVLIHYPTFTRVLTLEEATRRARRIVRRMKAA
jgi:hypothetical protein